MNIEIMQPTNDESFKKAVIISIGLHVAILLAFTIRSFFSEKFDPSLYERAVRVDMVALPDKIIEDDPMALTPKSQQMVAPSAAKEQTIDLKANKLKQKKAMEKLKALDALDNIKKQMQADEVKKAKPVTYKGNLLNSGTELRGVNKLQHDAYASLVEKHIKGFWFVPQWLTRKNLTAAVRVRIDENGHILGQNLIRSSGNAQFDEIAMSVALKASPVPAPQDKFVKILRSEGIVLIFGE